MAPKKKVAKKDPETKNVDEKTTEEKEVKDTEESKDATADAIEEEEGDFAADENDEDLVDEDKAKDSVEGGAEKTSKDGEDGKDGEEDDDDNEEDGDEADAKGTAKGKEKIKELEVDAELDSRDRIASKVALSEYDSTLDVFFSGGGSIVSSLSQGALQHLLSGVRANTGAKAGRYYFETKILESKTTESFRCLRLGVSVAKSSLFLGDGTTGNCCFDIGGYFHAATPENSKHKSPEPLYRKVQAQVIGILLNLESGSPNANTLSLFLDGVRVCEPQKLPEYLLGKALYPTITFKNVTLAVNLGSEGLALKSLPFKCRMIGDISAADAESSSFAAPAHGSKYSVVLPVGLPEEGFFDYVDRFIESHPEYVELSDRKIYEWCEKSELSCWPSKVPSSRDRPVFNFGHRLIDNGSIRPLMRTLTQLVKRHYVVAELKGNLLSKEREEVLARFGAPHYSVTAHVAVGEPTAEHKEWVHSQILAAHARRQAELAAARKRNEERKQQREKERAKKTGDTKKEEDEVKKEEEKEDEVKAEPDDNEPAAKKQKVGEGEEDKDAKSGEAAAPEVGPQVWWRPPSKQKGLDVLAKDVAKQYLTFTLPSETEGFQKVDFVWASKSDVEDYMKKWTSEKKATLIVEGLKVGDWFKEKEKAWTKLFEEMKNKKKEKKPEDKKQKGKDDEKDKKAPKKEDEKAEKKDEDKKADDKTDDDKKADDDKKPEGKEEEDDKKEPKEAPALDPLHAGGEDGKPLYANFQYEDWELLRWRYELHLVLHAFAIDVKDPEYVGIPLEHIGHYYKVYFKGAFLPRYLGCSDMQEVVELMEGVLKIDTKGKLSYLTPLLDKDAEILQFVNKVEEEREDRNRRMEAGDESARLKIPDARQRDRERKKGTGKGKKSSRKGRDDDARKTDGRAQERRGTVPGRWVRQRTFFKIQKQDRDRRDRSDLARPRDHHEASRPWDRSRREAPRFGNKLGVGRGAAGRLNTHRGQQESRNLQTRRPAQQDDRRQQHQGRQSAKGGSKQEAPRRHSSEPDAKRLRHNSNDSHQTARPSQTSRAPQTDRRPQSQSTQRREPQRNAAPAALPEASSRSQHREASRSGKAQSKGNDHRERDNGDRDRKGSFRDSSSGGREFRDGGSHRQSNSHHTQSKGGSKGGYSSHHSGNSSHHSSDRKSYDNGSNRTHSSSKGSKGGGRDDRRDGRDRGHAPSSRSDNHSSDRNRSSSARWPF